MEIKDYYQILQVPPSATLPEIKKSFRKLAQQYHPDKNNNDPYNTARFYSIKEAYEVLTNPLKKQYYLQQRWYHQHAGTRKTQTPVTPVSVLKQSLELERYISRMNPYRLDKEGLTNHILQLISDEAIEQLQPFDEKDISGKITSVLLKTCIPLHTLQVQQVCTQLQKLTKGQEQLSIDISQFMFQHHKKNQLEKYKPILVAFITIGICLLIFFAG
jgi:molecular chaperone DnaJ